MNKKPKSITDLKAEIPMSIDQVMCKALEKNPDDRYQHLGELLEDLRSISEGVYPEFDSLRDDLRFKDMLRRMNLPDQE